MLNVKMQKYKNKRPYLALPPHHPHHQDQGKGPHLSLLLTFQFLLQQRVTRRKTRQIACKAGDLGVHPRSRSCLLRLHQTGEEETSSPCVGRCQDRPVLLWPSAHRLATVGAKLQLTNTTPWVVDQLPLTNCN